MTTNSQKKPFRIFIDDVKIRHTSHWDEDFMSRAELDAAYATEPATAQGQSTTAPRDGEDKD